MIETYEDLQQHIRGGESNTLEFKKSTSKLIEGCKTITSFLNRSGGTLLFGISDDKVITGQTVSDKTRLDMDAAFSKIEPRPKLDIRYIEIPDTKRQVIAVHTNISNDKKPFLYDGRAYIRGEAGNRRMTQEEHQHLASTHFSKGNWESQPAEDATINDLDTSEIFNTLRAGMVNQRIPSDVTTDNAKTVLEHLGLMRREYITNAAIVLFGKKAGVHMPQCLLRLARFKGCNRSEFIDNKRLHGNIFELLSASMQFAQSHLPVASTFSNNQLARHDEPLFPLEAIREAIVNAFCHRDYRYHGGSISLAIYDDRLEVWSYGELPPGMTIERLEKNESVTRNPRIAMVLYHHKYFESWGRGVQKIIKLCTDAGHPSPYYQQRSGGLLLTIPSKQTLDTDAMKGIKHPAELKLTERQIAILQMLTNSGPLSTSQLHEMLPNAPSIRTIYQDLCILRDAGIVDATGQTKNRLWFMTQK